MARKKASIKSTPRLESEWATADEPAVEPKPKPVPEAAPELETVIVELPLGIVGKSEHLHRHVESRLRTQDQQLAMKRLLRGLQQSGAATADGRPVQRPGEALRWLLENISDSG